MHWHISAQTGWGRSGSQSKPVFARWGMTTCGTYPQWGGVVLVVALEIGGKVFAITALGEGWEYVYKWRMRQAQSMVLCLN